MWTKIVALALAADSLASAYLLRGQNYYEEKFYNWMTEHNVHFRDGAEFAHRLAIFSSNDDLIEAHNASPSTYKLGHNAFSHLTFDEFHAMYTGVNRPQYKEERAVNAFEGVETAASIDWSAKGAVTAVKDQGQCGSCWAFSTTGGLEGAYYLAHGNLQSFSEQQLVDCDHNGDLGCNGGLMDNAFAWIKTNGGLCTEASYGYTSGTSAKAGTCQTSCKNVAGSAVSTWTDVANSEASLLAAVNQQPISVAIEADQSAFQLYKSGVLTGQCGTSLDHGVLLVGYGTYTDGIDYWKVKNSWGPTWGMSGYVLLQRGVQQTGGQCGIASAASYPTVAASTEVKAIVQGSASVSDCGGASIIFSSFTVDPTNVQKNQQVTLTGSGTLTKPTTSGSYKIDVKYAGVSLYSTSGDSCADETINLPLNVGTIHTHGLSCPANPGPVSYGIDLILPTIAPSGSYTITITGTDQDQTSLMCFVVNMTL